MEKIALCENNDLKNLLIFLKLNWKNENTKFKNIKFFKWLYFNKNSKKYNFVLFKKKNIIRGCLGFFINDNSIKKVVWLSLWLVDQNYRKNVSGLSLLNFLKKKYKNSIIITSGINKKTTPIYKILRFKIAKLNQFYLINPKKKILNLVKVNKQKKYNFKKNDFQIIIKNKINFLENNKIFQRKEKIYLKDIKYFKKKYQFNPIFKYKFYIIKNTKKIFGFFIGRVCTFNKSKALRLVEFYGCENKISYLGNQFIDIMLKKNYEFIDFYNYGINKNYLEEAGFQINKMKSDTIIPNYFSPFVKKNIDIDVVFWPNNTKIKVFKGDGDQDRPNF